MIVALYRSGFKNRPLRVVAPINGRGTSMQPWLDASCTVLLFASNRARVGADLDGPWIYMSRRLGDGLERWSEPVPIISGENVIAVGDPTVARLPDGRARLFFVQYLMDGGNIDPRTGIGPMRTALFYVDEQAPQLLK